MTIFNTCPIKSMFRKNVKENNDKENGVPNYKKRMHFCRKLAYGMGGPPMQMLSNSMGFFLPIFLLETASINPYYLSAIQILARVWDAVTDPIMGYFVNRTKSRFGKFKPWIFFATPLSCLAFFLQFYVPNFPNQTAKFAFYCFTVIFVQTGLTAFHVPYSSMCMVLTTNIRDRDQLTSIRMAFEIIGVLFGAGIFGGIALRNRIASKPFNVNITNEMIETEKRDYILASSAVCIIFAFCSISVLFGTKEQDILKDKEEPYLPNLKKIMTFKPYLYVMFAFMFSSLGIQKEVIHKRIIHKCIHKRLFINVFIKVVMWPSRSCIYNSYDPKGTLSLTCLLLIMFNNYYVNFWYFYNHLALRVFNIYLIFSRNYCFHNLIFELCVKDYCFIQV